MKQRWRDDEIDFLERNYASLSTLEIKKYFTDRSWDAIKMKANQIGLHRLDTELRKADLSPLLSDTPVAFYWAGFIAADGSIVRPNWRLRIALASKDHAHVRKFAKFISSKISQEDKSISVQDKLILPKFATKFDLKERKTYNPPDLSWIANKRMFCSFLAGFIDGDGSIKHPCGRKDFSLSIKNHSSWLPVLTWMAKQLQLYSGFIVHQPKINKQGYAILSCSNSQILKWLKREIIPLNLPLLKRKWNKIDLSYCSRVEIARQNEANVVALVESGLRQTDISKRLQLTDGAISQILNRLKQKER